MFKYFVAVAVLCLGIGSYVVAQEWEMPKPQKQHMVLKKFVGKWTTSSQFTMAPDQSMSCEGTMESRMLGSFWAINESKGDMQGQQMSSIQTIGFDIKKSKFVGSWVDSETDYMWNYEGKLEDNGKLLVLSAKGPNLMAPGKETTFEDSYEFVSDDLIKSKSTMLGEDGKWVTFSVGEMKRVK